MLHLELSPGAEIEGQVSPNELATQLRTVAWLVGVAHARARGSDPHWEFERGLKRFEPPVREVHFASPLSLLVEMPLPILGSISAMSLLIYGVKRIWGLPLEFRTHHEEQRAQFSAAAARAVEAEERFADAKERMYARFREAEDRRRSELEPTRPTSVFQDPQYAKDSRDAAELFDQEVSDASEDLGWGSPILREIDSSRPSPHWKGTAATWLAHDDWFE